MTLEIIKLGIFNISSYMFKLITLLFSLIKMFAQTTRDYF